KRHLAMRSVPGVEVVYKTAYNDCSVSDFLLTAWMAVTGLGHCQRHSGGRFEKVPAETTPALLPRSMCHRLSWSHARRQDSFRPPQCQSGGRPPDCGRAPTPRRVMA